MSVDSLESPEAIEVFYSYAQKDEALREELEKHLGSLKHLQLIRGWHRRNIQIGTDWMDAVNVHLDLAGIILLLISSDFLASDYCHSIEMRRALERHQQGKARVIPIILRPVCYKGTPIDSLCVLPSGGKPVTKWSNRDEAFADVANGIRIVLQELKAASATNTFSSEGKNETGATLDKAMTNFMISVNRNTETASPENYAKQGFTHYTTIDTDKIIACFRDFIRPESQGHVLRLLGEAKMGKSHLLTKVFPSIVEQDPRVDYTILDLRHSMYDVPDIFHMICTSLGKNNFDFYYTAYNEWSNRLKKQQYSSTNPSLGQDSFGTIEMRDRELTIELVRDLAKLNDRLLLFLFDTVNKANKYIQEWLANTFLTHVIYLPHVKTVVAGRSLPEVNGAYARYCKEYRLQTVIDVEAFISYCQAVNARLGEQSVRDFAYACDYVPGMFVDLVYPKFIQEKDTL